jgi:hypothetical protein
MVAPDRRDARPDTRRCALSWSFLERVTGIEPAPPAWKKPSTVLAPRDPVELHEVVDGEFAYSHPGQFAVGDIELDSGPRLTVVSLYGIWDRRIDSRDLFVEAILHRAISDLTVVCQERAAAYVLVGGDLNIYSYSDGSVWGDRGITVLSCLARTAWRSAAFAPTPSPDWTDALARTTHVGMSRRS